MLEAARVLAERATAEKVEVTDNPQAVWESRLSWLSQQVLSRELEVVELKAVSDVWDSAKMYYATHPEAIALLTQVGQQPASTSPEVAGWMIVASMLLNLDEAMTHE